MIAPLGKHDLSPGSRIAIVGIGGIFPGAHDLERFWRNIETGRASVRDVAPGRWIVDPDRVHGDGGPAPERVLSRRGCFIEDFELDTRGLAIDVDLADALDPMCHLALHAGRQAVEDADLRDADRARTGVIIGNIALPTESSSALTRQFIGRTFQEQWLSPELRGSLPGEVPVHPLNRHVAGLPGGLIATALGLGGGSYTVDAACASSLYAVSLAIAELEAGRVDTMVAGGLSRPDCLYTQMGFSRLNALSPTGRCAPFDECADGLVVGEGAGIFVLRRLDDALDRGNAIHGVITGIGLSNDVGGSLLAPDIEGQLRAMRAAYHASGLQPGAIDLIECHATGTPRGDAVEFGSLQELWKETAGGRKRPGRCIIGSVKSNVGHLLTGAGAAGLMKVILALRHETLPPTAGFQRPAPALAMEGSPFRVLARARPWHRRADGAPRRAAVSAFGFGGINAHVVVEEWLPRQPVHPRPIELAPVEVGRPREPERPAVAIIALDARVGPWSDLAAFAERVLGGGGEVATSEPRWWGARQSEWFRDAGLADATLAGYSIDELEIPLGRFRIPPTELAEMLPQQLLMLDVTRRALCRMRDGVGGGVQSRTGVFIGIGLDLATCNFHHRWALVEQIEGLVREGVLDLDDDGVARLTRQLCDAAGPALSANRTMGALGSVVASRIAREFQIGGPSFAISSEESSGLRAFEVAVRALERGAVDRAVVGAVDFASDIRAVLATHTARRYSSDGVPRPFDRGADGGVFADGAAAVVLQRLADAVAQGQPIRAVVRGVGAATGRGAGDTSLCGETYLKALERAYADRGIEPATVDYVEARGSGSPRDDDMEAGVLGDFFVAREAGEPCFLGSASADVGDTGAAAGLISLVKMCLCFEHRVVPGIRHLREPRKPFGAGGRTLVAPREAHPWVRDRERGPRRGGISGFSIDGNCVHVILEEHVRSGDTDRSVGVVVHPVVAEQEALFAVEGDGADELVAGLAALRRHVEVSPAETDVDRMATRWWGERGLDRSRALAVTVVSATRAGLLESIDEARRSIVAGPDRQGGHGHRDDAPRVGRGRFYHSPDPLGPKGEVAFVYPGSGNYYAGMGREFSLRWPEILRRQDGETSTLASQLGTALLWNERETAGLHRFALQMLLAQVALATVSTDFFRAAGVEPDAAIGYSLGESAALCALRAWPQRDAMFRKVRESSLFETDLAGPCQVARRVWGLAPDEPVDWVTGLVDRAADEVRAAVVGRPRVYLLIVNAPRECVVGGRRVDVQNLVADLGCHWAGFEGSTTVHCEIVEAVRDAYHELHSNETVSTCGSRFYSGACAAAIDVNQQSAAASIVEQAVHGVDFPAVIRRAHADGVRVFLEMGPGGSCTRFIARILGDRPHLAAAVCQSSPGEVSSTMRALARLIAERFAVNLEAVLGRPSTPGDTAPPLPAENSVRVAIGGAPFDLSGLSAVPVPLRPARVERRASSITAGRRANRAMVPVRTGPTTTLLVKQVARTLEATASAHDAFLRLDAACRATMESAVSSRMAITRRLAGGDRVTPMSHRPVARSRPAPRGEFGGPVQGRDVDLPPPLERPGDGEAVLGRARCLEFAVGAVGAVLGEDFAPVDAHPSRVRLPDEPLMLVDRIERIEGTPRSLDSGRVITEHDILPGAWYLDGGRICACIAVEAGQADLFLSSYLGIDFKTGGLAAYRLLDAEVTFHRDLPGPGVVIRYDIRIESFFRQGDTHLFRFSFEATVHGEPLLSMRSGCAGFFTAAELASGAGIVHTRLDRQTVTGSRPDDWGDLVPMQRESYTVRQVDGLRLGDLEACFGAEFSGLRLGKGLRLPEGLMSLIDSVDDLDPAGGRYGLGSVRASAAIRPDDWYLRCHFVDDRVMPGTLMFECCLHALRILLLRMGWVSEQDDVRCEPVPGVSSQLRCRGQVTETTATVTYEVTISELGSGPEPFAIAEALIKADGKPIVEIRKMSLRLVGSTRAALEALWRRQRSGRERRPAAIFDRHRILEYAIGRPSRGFGERYEIFDGDEHVLARLPGPPYLFMDRVTRIEGAEPWKLVAGARIESQYDIPGDAWYFHANREDHMPFAVLLEIALQPCGWLAAYLGSALAADTDVAFRNLGGRGVTTHAVNSSTGRLTVRVGLTRVSNSGGMIIQNFDFAVLAAERVVYEGDTYFGFFSGEALANQVGLRDVESYAPTAAEIERGRSLDFPREAPFPDSRWGMIDRIDLFVPDGGPAGLGFIRGTAAVDSSHWCFRAHFYQDSVVPGSLGLEAFLQLLRVVAMECQGDRRARARLNFDPCPAGNDHRWTYRGQIVPRDREVTVEAVVTAVDEASGTFVADGLLIVDGRVIYRMQDFAVKVS